LFRPDSAHGIYPSERSPLERYPNVSAQKHPHAVSPTGTAIAEATARSGRPRLLGFDPSESTLRPSRVFNAPSRRMLPWVLALPGLTCENLNRDPSRLPLTRFANLLPEGYGRRRLRVSIGSRLASPVLDGKPPDQGETTLIGFSHQSVPEHSDEGPFEL
jgi:hypothetical protein